MFSESNAPVFTINNQEIYSQPKTPLEKGKKEALSLAFRGARFAGQYAIEADKSTSELMKKAMQKHRFRNRFGMTYHGIDEIPYFSEIGKTYLKMLEKTTNAVLIPKYLDQFGLLDQVSKSINHLNVTAKLMWGYELKTIDDMVWDTNFLQLATDSAKRHGKDGNDIRFTGKHYAEKNKGPLRFITSTFAVSRMLSFLLTGI